MLTEAMGVSNRVTQICGVLSTVTGCVVPTPGKSHAVAIAGDADKAETAIPIIIISRSDRERTHRKGGRAEENRFAQNPSALPPFL